MSGGVRGAALGGLPHPPERSAHLGVRQGALVAALGSVVRQRGRERVAGGVVGAVALAAASIPS